MRLLWRSWLAVEELEKVDFVVCFGGDGSVLYVNSLFSRAVPPVIAFHCGSLGFVRDAQQLARSRSRSRARG